MNTDEIPLTYPPTIIVVIILRIIIIVICNGDPTIVVVVILRITDTTGISVVKGYQISATVLLFPPPADFIPP